MSDPSGPAVRIRSADPPPLIFTNSAAPPSHINGSTVYLPFRTLQCRPAMQTLQCRPTMQIRGADHHLILENHGLLSNQTAKASSYLFRRSMKFICKKFS